MSFDSDHAARVAANVRRSLPFGGGQGTFPPWSGPGTDPWPVFLGDVAFFHGLVAEYIDLGLSTAYAIRLRDPSVAAWDGKVNTNSWIFARRR